MRFKALILALHGWPRADIGDTFIGFIARACANGINAKTRAQIAIQIEVGGWIAKRAAGTIALLHRAFDFPVAAKRFGREFHIALLKRLADAGGGPEFGSAIFLRRNFGNTALMAAEEIFQ